MGTLEGEVSGLLAKRGDLQEKHQKLEIMYDELVYERIVKNDLNEASSCRRILETKCHARRRKRGNFDGWVASGNWLAGNDL
jgi:hypothetical protein